MTKEEQIALDAWRGEEASRLAKEMSASYNEWEIHRYDIYRELVVNDVRPPVVVDRAADVWEQAWRAWDEGYPTTSDRDTTIIIKAYGDERFAEGERAGIELEQLVAAHRIAAYEAGRVAGRGFNEAQREQLLLVVQYLDWMAGEGKCAKMANGDWLCADELIYDLFAVFEIQVDGEYLDAAIRALKEPK